MRSSRLPAVIAVVALLAIGRFTIADVIHLKDGSSVSGMVKHVDDGWIVRNNGKVTRVSSDQVESIELTPSTAPSATIANDRLESLRRSVDPLTELTEIVPRFQRFINQNTGTAAGDAATKDLAVWRDRLNQKMVKVGSTWVTPAQRPGLLDQAGESADAARQLMKQGRSKEAEPLLLSCLATDPQNATALYLTGLLRYERDQIPDARKAFESVSLIVPDHAPTLNNLGVVQWRQRQYISALASFDAAMLAAPVNRIILDNVAVAFGNLPADLQKSPVTLKALRHYNEQDQQLADQLARAGLHRYGSLWVSDKDLDQMKQQEKAIQDRLDQLSGDFDQTKQRVDDLDQDISNDQTQMHRIEANSILIDPRTGEQTQAPYPSAYYEMARDVDKMTRQRREAVTRLDALKKQAQDLQASRPSLKSRGVQLMIGVEGAPIRIPAAPVAATTQAVGS
jgi:tetratricopeptide (TPR) repeat protein